MKSKQNQGTDEVAPKFEAYSVGVCFASVCTSLSQKDATARLNREHPTGISSKWALSGENFATGQDNGCPCDRFPQTHRHFLFNC